MTEHQLQCAVIQWTQWMRRQHPELNLLFAIPNGGQRHFSTGKKLKAEGVSAGVPDLVLPVARGGHHGLWIELKTKTGRVRASQAWWHEQLRRQGHKVEVCRSFEEATEVILNYLANE